MAIDPMQRDEVRTSAAPAILLIAPALVGVDDVAADARLATRDGGGNDRTASDAFPCVEGARFRDSERAALSWEQALLARLCGADEALLSAQQALPVPAAALLYPLDTGAVATHVVMADPVAMTPGRDEAALTPPQALGIRADERDALFSSANDLLAEDGLSFVAGANGRNYLTGLDPQGLDTLPTHVLARRDVGHHLPDGEEGRVWRRLMTELQMLWHAHPVNEARAESAQLPINGVWFWGGDNPALIAKASTPCTVVSDDALAQALATQAEALVVAGDAVTVIEQATTTGGNLIVVDLTAYEAWLANDGDALAKARSAILERWVQPLAQAVLDGRGDSLDVCCGDGRYMILDTMPGRSTLRRLAERIQTWWVSRRRS